jgi:hypothetical protein
MPQQQPQVVPGRRHRGLLVFFLAAPLIAVGLLPAVAARTPLVAWAIRTAARWDGSVTVRSASLGWFSPVVLEGVELRGAGDRPFFELAGLASQKTLWQILSNFAAAGSFRLDKPKLTVVLRQDGSNLEDLLAKYQTAGSGRQRVGLAVQIVDGSMTVVDAQSQQSWEVRQVQLALGISPGMTLPEKIEFGASLADAKQPGSLRLRFDQQPREAPSKDAPPTVLDPEHTRGRLHLEAEAIPAAMFERLASRLAGELRLSGTLASKLDLQWIGAEQVGVDAELSVGDLVFGCGPGKQTVRLDRGRAACRAALQGGQIDAEIQARNLRIAGPWGNLSEPLAGLTLSGGWDPKTQRGHVDAATLSGEALAAEAKKIVLARAAGGAWELSGQRLVVGPEVRIELARGGLNGRQGTMQHGRPLNGQPPNAASGQVQLNPAIGRGVLKFIVPIVAETGDAQGTFSIELDGYRIPLAEPARGELSGRLLVHSLEVAPGPLVREIAQLLTRIEPVRLGQQSAIAFRMLGGRIYHQGIELRFSDATIRTYGSVGLDQSLALTVEMPIPAKWVAGMPVAASLGDQVLRVPISGTLDRPRVDPGELAKTSRQLLGHLLREDGMRLEQLLAAPR